MSLVVHIFLPPLLLVAVVLWVAGGFWCERNIALRHESLIQSAIGFVAFLLWGLVMIAGLLLFGGSALGLFFRLFIQDTP